MNKYFQTLLFASVIAFFVFTSCNHNHNLDPILAEAQAIQDEALHLGIGVDSIINAKLLIAKDSSDYEFLNQLKSEVAVWRLSLVAVPGSKHKCNHDHGEHVHIVGSDASHLSPADNKKVQEEWKTVIDNINQRVRQIIL
jgi:hypothetical protein